MLAKSGASFSPPYHARRRLLYRMFVRRQRENCTNYSQQWGPNRTAGFLAGLRQGLEEILPVHVVQGWRDFFGLTRVDQGLPRGYAGLTELGFAGLTIRAAGTLQDEKVLRLDQL